MHEPRTGVWHRGYLHNGFAEGRFRLGGFHFYIFKAKNVSWLFYVKHRGWRRGRAVLRHRPI